MSEFQYLRGKQIRRKPLTQIVQYYKDLRAYEFRSQIPLKHIRLRKLLFPFMQIFLKVDQIMTHQSIQYISRVKYPKSSPVIFACTHIGGKDVERATQAIHAQAWLMLSNLGEVYRLPVFSILKMNGVIALESFDKDDRHIAYERAVELLKKKGNLLIFPEAAWNVSQNLPVLKLFDGAIRMAVESGAVIVPIAMEQYGSQFVINAGKYFKPQGDTKDDINFWKRQLRDMLATLKWDIWRTQPSVSRKDITNDYLSFYHAEIIARSDPEYHFKLEDAIKESFHDRNIPSPEEVFSIYKDMEPSMDNAFLWRNNPYLEYAYKGCCYD